MSTVALRVGGTRRDLDANYLTYPGTHSSFATAHFPLTLRYIARARKLRTNVTVRVEIMFPIKLSFFPKLYHCDVAQL